MANPVAGANTYRTRSGFPLNIGDPTAVFQADTAAAVSSPVIGTQPTGVFSTGSGTLSRITQSNFTYLGSFTAPDGSFGTPEGFGSAAARICYNSLNNSFFIQGNVNRFRIAEMTIPAQASWKKPPQPTTALVAGTVIQNFASDPSNGTVALQMAADGSGGSIQPGGILIRGSELIMTYYVFYDVTNTQSRAHFRRPKTISTNSGIVGMCALSPIAHMPTVGNHAKKAGYYSGYMCEIPPAWQVALGGTAITGQSGIPDPKRQSAGPSAIAFDPLSLSATVPTPAECLLAYVYHDTPSNPIWGVNGVGAYSAQNNYWNACTHIRGAFISETNRSIVFFGDHALGTYCYGYPAFNPDDPNGNVCPDSSRAALSDKGPHMPPYRRQVFEYDLDDLIAVKAGTKQPWEPVANIWFPTDGYSNSSAYCGGCAWDPVNRILYESELNIVGGTNYKPVFNAYSVS